MSTREWSARALAAKIRTVLYVGEMNPHYEGGTCLQRMRALEFLGCEVVPVNAYEGTDLSVAGKISARLRRQLFRSVRHPLVNREIVETVAARDLDVLWIDKGIAVTPATLREVRILRPRIKIVGYSPDDIMNPAHRTREFIRSLACYDVFFTTKSFNVREIRAFGCPRVEFVGNSYDPDLHRPVEVDARERERLGGPVGFIGTAEGERANSVAFLAAHGVRVKVWGDRWEEWRRRTGGAFVVAGPSQYGEQYVRIVQSFDINLCFLRKVNRDLQTTRSVEIPACGAFMLAERTTEHLDLFQEGQEAEFFGNDEELLEKARFYLAHPERRKAIAAAGLERCLRDGYSNRDRLASMFETITTL